MTVYLMNVIYSWFMVGAFCLAINLSINTIFSDAEKPGLTEFGYGVLLTYISLILILFIASLSVKPKRIEDLYKTIAILLGAFEMFIIVIIGLYIFRYDETNVKGNPRFVTVLLCYISLVFLFIVLINCEMKTVLFGFLHYLFLLPTYINVFLIYSICNVHDCTWGNRPDILNEEERGKSDEFEEYRAKWVIVWVLCNAGFSYLLIWINQSSKNGSSYLFAIGGVSVFILTIKALGGVLHVIVEPCLKTFKNNQQNPRPSLNNI